MRPGWFISLLLHAALAGALAMNWSFLGREEPLLAANIVPVEIVTLGPQTNVRPIRPEQLEEIPAEAAIEEPVEAAPVDPVAPAPPVPAQQPQRPPQRELDLADLENVLSNSGQRESSRREVRSAPAGESGASPRAGIGAQTGETVALDDRIASLINDQLDRGRCYAPPAGRPNAEQLRTTVRMQLDRSGALIGAPRIVGVGSGDRAFDEAALRAIRACAPFDFPDDVKALYPRWKDVTLNFDPQNF